MSEGAPELVYLPRTWDLSAAAWGVVDLGVCIVVGVWAADAGVSWPIALFLVPFGVGAVAFARLTSRGVRESLMPKPVCALSDAGLECCHGPVAWGDIARLTVDIYAPRTNDAASEWLTIWLRDGTELAPVVHGVYCDGPEASAERIEIPLAYAVRVNTVEPLLRLHGQDLSIERHDEFRSNVRRR